MVIDIDRLLVLIGCIASTILFTTSIASNVWVKTNGRVVKHDHSNTLLKGGSSSSTNGDMNTATVDTTVMYYGIWMYCLQNGNCQGIGHQYSVLWKVTPTWLQAVRILSCLATILEALGTVKGLCGIIRNSANSDAKEPKICIMLGALFMLIALSIFTGYVGPRLPEKEEWGWGYIIGWFGTSLTIVYGLFAIS